MGGLEEMTAVHYDSSLSDDARRARIYAGDIFVYRPLPAVLQLVEFAKELISEAFGGLDPEKAQDRMPVSEYAAKLAVMKPAFIHHPGCKQLLPEILQSLGCDPEQTYFDVPRMRTSTSDGYLTTGIAYAFHPHRDTWYSAPLCQINWWFPIYPLAPDNCMAFHPQFWAKGLKNTSHTYDYQEWNRSARYAAAQQIGVDSRPQPHAVEQVQTEPDIRLLPPPGGLIVFSGAQLHSSVPNSSGRTRFSIDFRTVHVGDARALRGAPNVDSAPTGTTMGDYLRCTDLSHLPEDASAPYDAGPPQPVVHTATTAK
jgi:hypothetical protein